jgi:hypothetical protein
MAVIAALVFCYVETIFGGARPAQLDLSPCTHVIEAFLLPAEDGSVKPAYGVPRHLETGGKPLLIAVGGSTIPGATFAAIARDDRALERFVDELARFVAAHGYAGVDIDWEFPAPADRALHLKLVRAVRKRLPKALLLAGISPLAHFEGYDFPSLARTLNYFVHFGYDFRDPELGPWASRQKLTPDGSDKPVEASVRGAASELIRRGVPREKLIISLPMYASDGRPWIELRTLKLPPPTPRSLESNLGGAYVTGPDALEQKARAVLCGDEIEGGAAAGIALWQLGQQGPFDDLTNAVRRALTCKR